MFGFVFSYLCFELLFQQSESDGGFCRRSRFWNDDDAKRFVFQEGLQFKQIVFADVVSGKQYERIFMFRAKKFEWVG